LKDKSKDHDANGTYEQIDCHCRSECVQSSSVSASYKKGRVLDYIQRQAARAITQRSALSARLEGS